MLTGGCACNLTLRKHMENMLKSNPSFADTVPLLYAEDPRLNCDNAAMIAWMGHELLRAGHWVDIRDRIENGHPKIPLGNFVKDLLVEAGPKHKS